MIIVIKNSYSVEYNKFVISKAIAKMKIDIDTIKKVYITDNIINFVI